MRRLITILSLVLVFLASCADDASRETAPAPEDTVPTAEDTVPTAEDTVPTAEDTVTTAEETGPVTIPLSLYVMVDAEDPASSRSSARTVAEVEAISVLVGEIWSQADISFDPIAIHRIEAPPEVLAGIAAGNTDPFFDQVGRGFEVPDAGAINGFYVPEAFGANGFAPIGSRVFFVIDEPTVPDERVTSHEIGHLFGLRHDLEDQGRLMFSGTDGTDLVPVEQVVARYGAEGILSR